jgi:hypothetical protein
MQSSQRKYTRWCIVANAVRACAHFALHTQLCTRISMGNAHPHIITCRCTNKKGPSKASPTPCKPPRSSICTLTVSSRVHADTYICIWFSQASVNFCASPSRGDASRTNHNASGGPDLFLTFLSLRFLSPSPRFINLGWRQDHRCPWKVQRNAAHDPTNEHHRRGPRCW